MKVKIKASIAFLLVFCAVILGSFDVFAAEAKNGWVEENGYTRYYENGEYVTGSKKIGIHTYIFDSNGNYVGVEDKHVPIGTADTMQGSAYRNAVKAKNPILDLNFNVGEAKVAGATITNAGAEFNSHTAMYPVGAPNSSSINCIIKSSTGKLVKRDEGDFAVSFKDSTAASNGDCYIDVNFDNKTSVNPAGAKIIYEAEYRLGDDYCSEYTVSFLQAIYRSAKPSAVFNAFLTMKNNGYVYAPSYSSSEYLFKLTSDCYTRVSVAIDPEKNTFDVYVNGILVKAGIKYYSGEVDLTKEQITTIRTLQFGSRAAYEGSVIVDNMTVYQGTEPVCVDKTTSPKNGAYEEGSYLRFYKNNLIASGRQYVTGTYFGKTFNEELIIFENGQAFVGCSATIKNGDTVISSSIVEGNRLIIPSAVSMDGKKFINWKVTDSNGKITLAAPGDKLMLESDVTVEALGVELEMLDGASVKKNGEGSLRFVAKISKAEYNALISAGATVEAHMLVAPASFYADLYGYHTAEALANSGCDNSKISDTVVSGWFKETDGYYYFTGSSVNIAESNYTEKYSAVAYLVIKDKSGNVTTIYSDYSDEDNCRSVYEVAFRAYNDRVTEKGVENYGTKIKFSGVKTYSSYSKSENENLKKFVDKVVTLGVTLDGVGSDGNYYESPYDIEAQKNGTVYNIKISGKNVGETIGLSVNGKLANPSDYSKGGSEISFTFDTKAQSLWVNKEEQTAEMWYLAVSTDDERFSNYDVEFPATAPNDDDYGFYWSYDKAPNYMLQKESFGCSENFVGPHYKYEIDKESGQKVWDMSDWQGLKFHAYLPEKYEKATFFIIFGSENVDTDGSDYFSRLITLYPGWNSISFNKIDVSASRSPLGWDRITGINFTANGWSQTNKMNEEIYLTSIELYDQPFGVSSVLDASQLQESATFAVGGYAGIVNGEYYHSNPYDQSTKAFKDGEIYYLPANVLAIANDPNATYYAGLETLVFKLGDKEYFISADKCTADGERITLKYPAKVSSGAVYLSAEDMMSIFGYTQIYTDVMGLVSLSNEENLFDHERDYNKIADIISECIYIRPTGSDIADDVMSYSGAKHPYIMMNQKDFDALNYYKNTDKTLQKYIQSIEGTYGVGSRYYNAAPVNYHITDGVRLLSISREAMNRLLPWSTLYKLYEFDDPTSAKKIAERVWTELKAINQFMDWHPSHYLDTAELAYPVAIAYDWLYDYWNDEQRGIIEGMLYGFALKTTTALGGSYGLASATNNWNGVCNGGIMTAALALVNVQNDVTWKANSSARPGHGETGVTVKELVDIDGGTASSIVEQTVTKYITKAADVREDVITVLSASIAAIEKGMWVYGPDGGYEEGPGYWSYGTTYTHIFISALDSACGTNYGIYEAPGFEHSAYFTTYLGSMNTTWGFHDGGSGSADTCIAPWFAKKSGDGNINTIRRQAIDEGWKGISIYDVIHFNPHIVNHSVTLAKDAYYSLDAIMTFRDSWDVGSNTFAGLHGGDNQASHGDLDIGNFVICVDGTYMICDLGSENYNVNGYFGSYRWNYYRKRAEGQNTLVMRPAGTSWLNTSGDANGNRVGDPDQNIGGISEVVRYESGNNSALGVIDMSPAYDDMSEGIRGMYYTDNRTTIVVQDEAKFSRSMDIWWFAHTQGEITVSEDGKSAVIKRNGICLYAELVTNVSGAKFEAIDAESLDKNYKGDTEPHPTYSGYVENSRASFKKLCVTAKNVKELKLAVVFKVVTSEDNCPELGTTYAWKDIKDWKVD